MHIEQVNPRDEVAFVQWFAVVAADERHMRPGEPGSLLHEERALSLAGTGADPDVRRELLVARERGEVVGAARLELPQRDNLHLCEVVLVVHPEARLRGTGRALDGEVERRARAAGRTTLLTVSDEPPGREGRSPGRLSALALGYHLVQEEVRRDLDLPLDARRAARLERSCAPYAGGYDLRTWRDRCPDDLAADCAGLQAAMSTDVPKDQMDWRPEVWDCARLRRDEELSRSMDRTYVGAGAVHRASGRMVAFTRLGVPRSARRRAYQWETLVLRGHRGHRLGTCVKTAALGELVANSPDTAFVSTWNAQENAPMIAVNEALGFRTNGRLAVLQKRLT